MVLKNLFYKFYSEKVIFWYISGIGRQVEIYDE